MSAAPRPAVDCEVIGGGKLPAASGGETALCRAIGDALERSEVAVRSVRVEVRERGRFAIAVVLPDARQLPELNFARSDGAVSASTFVRVADAVANHASQAGKL